KTKTAARRSRTSLMAGKHCYWKRNCHSRRNYPVDRRCCLKRNYCSMTCFVSPFWFSRTSTTHLFHRRVCCPCAVLRKLEYLKCQRVAKRKCATPQATAAPVPFVDLDTIDSFATMAKYLLVAERRATSGRRRFVGHPQQR